MFDLISYFEIFAICNILSAAGAYVLAQSKGRRSLSWAFWCFGLPPLFLILALLPPKSGYEGQWKIISLIGFVAAILSSLIGSLQITGADYMILDAAGIPTCSDGRTHQMVVEWWAEHNGLEGNGLIVGISNEKELNSNDTLRVCTANSVGLDRKEHAIQYKLIRKIHGTTLVEEVKMIK